MIMLLNENFRMIKVLYTDEQLFHYLKARESFKSFDEQEKGDWEFSQYPYQLIADFMKEMQKSSFVHMVQQACQRREDMVVIRAGDAQNPSFHIVTPLDVAALQKEWCKSYCEAHGLHAYGDEEEQAD
jgi:hypothetical protein